MKQITRILVEHDDNKVTVYEKGSIERLKLLQQFIPATDWEVFITKYGHTYDTFLIPKEEVKRINKTIFNILLSGIAIGMMIMYEILHH